MTTCVQSDVNGNLQVVNPQPADLSACQFIILAPVEVPGISQALDGAQAGGFFAFGFSCIVISYLAAFAVGVNLKVLRTARN